MPEIYFYFCVVGRTRKQCRTHVVGALTAARRALVLLLGAVNDSRHRGRRARGSRARDVPSGVVDRRVELWGRGRPVPRRAGRAQDAARCAPQPVPIRAFETLRGSSRPRTAPAHLSRAPLPRFPPSRARGLARARRRHARTHRGARTPPRPGPRRGPPLVRGFRRRRRRARRFPGGDPRRAPPGRVHRHLGGGSSPPAPSGPRHPRPVPPQVRAPPRGPARAPPRRGCRRRVRLRLRARRSRRGGSVPRPSRLPPLRRRLRARAPPPDVPRGRPRGRRPRPHGDDAMPRRVARTRPRAAIGRRARGFASKPERAITRARRRPSRARARRLATRYSADVSRGYRARDDDVFLGRVRGRATRRARVFRRVRRDVAAARRSNRRRGGAESETTHPRGRPRGAGGERQMGQRRRLTVKKARERAGARGVGGGARRAPRRTRRRREGEPSPRRRRFRSRRRPRRRGRFGGRGVPDADVRRGGGVARAHRGVGARGVGARRRGGRPRARASASPL